MAEDEIKVTDKRMFTPEGELKDEFQHLSQAPAEESAAPEVVADAPPESDSVASPAPEPSQESPASEPDRSRVEPPAVDGLPEELGFFDLVSLVAQPIAIYLGDAKLPGGESAENLDMARLHIDLLEVLKEKTAGNLTEQEQAFLKDLLYQLRLRYVQKRG